MNNRCQHTNYYIINNKTWCRSCDFLIGSNLMSNNENNDAKAAVSENGSAKDNDLMATRINLNEQMDIVYSNRIDRDKVANRINELLIEFLGRLAEIQYNISNSYYEKAYLKDEFMEKEDEE